MLLVGGAVIIAGSYLILIPDLPKRDQAWISKAIPISVVVGLIAGLMAVFAEKRWPRLFPNRFDPKNVRVWAYGLLGLLMLVSTKTLILGAASMSGTVLLAATPLLRFQPTGKLDSDSSEAGQLDE